jgi:hypothetical protein
MGQYYYPTIISKRKKDGKLVVMKAFCTHDYSNGAKLMEHSYVDNYVVKECENALATDFYGYPFAWVGDYADAKFGVGMYAAASDKAQTNGKPTPYEELPTYKYIINFTKKVYIEIPEKTDDWIIHPLPLLCADGNGKGCGDYFGTNMEIVGSWAYDKIGVANEVPSNITKELFVRFTESYYGGDDSVNDYHYIKH